MVPPPVTGAGAAFGHFLFSTPTPPTADKAATDLQQRDALLAQLAALDYPQQPAPPAALPPAPPAIDWGEKKPPKNEQHKKENGKQNLCPSPVRLKRRFHEHDRGSDDN
jgi:hypothetical protein